MSAPPPPRIFLRLQSLGLVSDLMFPFVLPLWMESLLPSLRALDSMLPSACLPAPLHAPRFSVQYCMLATSKSVCEEESLGWVDARSVRCHTS